MANADPYPPPMPSQRRVVITTRIGGILVGLLYGSGLLLVIGLSPYGGRFLLRWENILLLSSCVAGVLLGALTIALGAALEGVRKGVAVWVIGQLLVLMPLWYLMQGSLVSVAGFWVLFSLIGAACAGNRVMADGGSSVTPRLLGGLAAAHAIVLGTLVVLARDTGPIAWLIWRSARSSGPLGIVVMMMVSRALLVCAGLSMGAAMLLSLINACRARTSRGLCRAMLLAAHLALAMFLALVTVSVVRLGAPFWLLYGLLVCVVGLVLPVYQSGVALADALRQALYAQEVDAAVRGMVQAASTTGADDAQPGTPPEDLPVPGDHLEQRLENLYQMLEDGRIDEETYRAQRQRLIDDA